MPGYALENVLPKGILTGSRAFGCHNKESDYDIVIIESLVPDYSDADDYQVHEILNLEPMDDCDEMHSDTNEDGNYEYDKVSIWGPIKQVIKYWYLEDPKDENSEVCINLFVYEDEYKYLYKKFKELNLLMKLIHKDELQDKDKRIDCFIDIIHKVGITDA